MVAQARQSCGLHDGLLYSTGAVGASMPEHEDQDYDFGITIISPEGRIFQVEYARESVKRGATALGVLYDNGVVLLAERRIHSRLIEPAHTKKLYVIDQHIAVASSGLVADSRVLIDIARVECQNNRIRYSEELPVGMLARAICEVKQGYTQHGGVRPFGAALLICGIDAGVPALFETDPSGAYRSIYAGGIGRGTAKVQAYLEVHWHKGLTKDEAIELALHAIADQYDEDLTVDNLELAVLSTDGGYQEIDGDALGAFLAKLTPPTT